MNGHISPTLSAWLRRAGFLLTGMKGFRERCKARSSLRRSLGKCATCQSLRSPKTNTGACRVINECNKNRSFGQFLKAGRVNQIRPVCRFMKPCSRHFTTGFSLSPYRLAREAPLANRVFLLRCISLIIASFSIPLVFRVAYRVTGRCEVALGTAALLTAMPEFMLDVCRVGNECLGVILFSWLILLCLEPDTRKTGILAGIALGLGLLTKAYFLTAVPAIGVLYIWRIWTAKQRRIVLQNAVLTFGMAALIGGWWYLRNHAVTGTWSGLSESVALRRDTWWQFLEGVRHVQWGRAIDSILMSHVWFGGWSSLTVRSWMYHAVFIAVGIAIVGVALNLKGSTEIQRSSLYPLLAFYGFFWAGQLYNVLLLFLSKGVSTSMGWYMYCVIAAEIVLLVVGLCSVVPMRVRAWLLSGLVLCAATLDFYTVDFVSIPYYSGLRSHRLDGSMAAFLLRQLHDTPLREVIGRLCVNKADWLQPHIFEVLWACYAVATLSLIGLSFWAHLAKRDPTCELKPSGLR